MNISITCLTPPLFCACSKTDLGFSTSYDVVFFTFNDLRGKVIVRVVDIGGIVDYHCLSFLSYF